MKQTGPQRGNPGDVSVFRFAKKLLRCDQRLCPARGFLQIWTISQGQETSPFNSALSRAIHSELGEALQPLNRLNIPSLGIQYHREVNWDIKSNKHGISVASEIGAFWEHQENSFSSHASLNCSLWLILEVEDLRLESYFPHLTTKLIWLLK